MHAFKNDTQVYYCGDFIWHLVLLLVLNCVTRHLKEKTFYTFQKSKKKKKSFLCFCFCFARQFHGSSNTKGSIFVKVKTNSMEFVHRVLSFIFSSHINAH